MAILSQLLAEPSLGLRLVQAAPEDPQLSWVSTTELLDLAQYLEGGEIVLTTGLSLDGEDARWRDFAASLSRARIAAIGFGLGVSHDRLPRPLVAAASDYRLALFEVPPPVPFIAVSKAVAGLLRADEMRSARQALQAHQRLVEGALSGSDSASVLASVAQATGRRLALQAADGGVVASTAGYAAALQADPESVEIVPLEDGTGSRLLVAAGAPLGPEARAVVAAGAMVLGLNLRSERAEHERERERWSRLTSALLEDRAGASALGLLDPAAMLPGEMRAIAVQGASENVAAWRRSPRRGLERLVTGGAPREGGVSLAWQLCGAEAEQVEAALDAAAGHDLDAVVGRPAPTERLALSANSAGALVGTLSRLGPLYASPRVPVVRWAERDAPLLEALLACGAGATGGAAGAGEGTARSLSAAVLGALALGPRTEGAASDEERESLRATLRALLAHHGRRTPTAAELGVHRNTLRDRVSRIEQLTGRSIEDPDARAELWLALRMEQQLPGGGWGSEG